MVGVGHLHIPDKLKLIEKGGTDLRYVWELCVHHNGHNKVFNSCGVDIKIGWKPYWLYIKGNVNGGAKLQNMGMSITDYIESKPPDKSLHKWAQSAVEANYWIGRLTLPGQLVFDPCMGPGTFGIPATLSNRQFIGIEKDQETFKKAQVNFTILRE